MAQVLFDASIGLSISDDATGVAIYEQIALAGVPGDAGLSADELALSDNAPLGSFAIDSATGFQYRKNAVGAGVGTWSRTADLDDIAAAGNDTWRDPALVKDDTAYANLAAATAAVNTGTVDGVTVAEDDRILFTGITGQNKNVYIINGTPGAGATLVEDTNTPTTNDAILIDAGTSAGKQFNYNLASDTWVNSNVTSLDELGFLRAFVGKTSSGSELPDYTTNNYVLDNDTLEVAIGKLDAQMDTNATNIGTNTTSIGNIQTEVDAIETSLGAAVNTSGVYVAHSGSNYVDGNLDLTEDLLDLDAQVKVNADAIAGISNDDVNQNSFMGKNALGVETPTYSSALVITQNDDLETAIGDLDAHADRTNHETNQSGITTLTVVDSMLVDDVKAARWLVHISQGANVQTFEIDAVHDGTPSSDAVDVDYTKYAKLKLNSNIAGLTIDVSLNGAAAAQVMRLTAAATAAIEVSAARLSVV